MNKLKVFFFLLIFNFASINAQIKSGEIVYKVVFQVDSVLIKKSDRLSQMYDLAIKSSDRISQKLIFNQKISRFELVDLIEDEGVKMAIAWCNCNKVFYEDLDKKTKFFNNANDNNGIFKANEFVVIDSLNLNWNITKESKNIENLKCYKATQIIKYKNSKGIFNKTVVAWFTPEIPFSFGPKGYGGLPGLILELHDKNIIYGVHKIKLSEDAITISLPINGEIVTNDEYENILKERYQKRTETIENNKN
ncbi:GLPGLI family protein [Flavobacterium sp.]|jgi:GLPGLI family protein|uniref:GLPGLI family protein n=1 Tax=Flavobacterium sp. TaxID=239 RepID=UPI0037C0AFBA